MASLYHCTDLKKFSWKMKSFFGHFSSFSSMYIILSNFGTLVQMRVKYMKSNDFLCTETCTTQYRNLSFCTEISFLDASYSHLWQSKKKRFMTTFALFWGLTDGMLLCIRAICTEIQKISVQIFLHHVMPLTRSKWWESKNKRNALATNWAAARRWRSTTQKQAH